MIVFTDNEDRIIAYDSTNKQYKNKIDVGDFFKDKCDSVIFGYKCEPSYQYEMGDHDLPILDENGEMIPIKDEDGNPIMYGGNVYPFIPYLEIYQSAYETMTLALADLIGGAYE